MRAQQRMAGHHANDGQWDRSHDNQRHQIRFKLRNHQQINQHHTHGVSNTHIAEGFVSHRPFAIPCHRNTA
ncbi:Uncharacterised protein [Vibrio cholerae]|nr:Uncharacterised protein [Vibrio cholerae]CSC16794.1 Uncharacterised protein [Vibrio cholerae]CSD34002.1 Uncharacterised protein [Vibrio cholerae]